MFSFSSSICGSIGERVCFAVADNAGDVVVRSVENGVAGPDGGRRGTHDRHDGTNGGGFECCGQGDYAPGTAAVPGCRAAVRVTRVLSRGPSSVIGTLRQPLASAAPCVTTARVFTATRVCHAPTAAPSVGPEPAQADHIFAFAPAYLTGDFCSAADTVANWAVVVLGPSQSTAPTTAVAATVGLAHAAFMLVQSSSAPEPRIVGN